MAKVIVGRVKEKEILSNALNSSRSELIAIYGRRRIGKTFLIREFYEKGMVFSMTGFSDGNRDVQIKNFQAKLNEVTDEFKQEKALDWIDCFVLLKKYITGLRKSKHKKVIFIDEFPWIATNKSGFLAAFENFWNDFCVGRTDLVVVVCGSAASYMVKKLIKNHKGLSKRITQKINLRPFTLGEVKDFFEHKNNPLLDYELLKIYMSLGGVPEYLEQVHKGESAVSTIERLCFQPGAYLEDEFDDVFDSLFESSSFHKKIIDVLAGGAKKGLNRTTLLDKCGLDSSGRFSQSLVELEISGFVLKYDSYKGKSKETLYRIYDEYCLFYLQFMKPFKGNSWLQLYQKSEYLIWCGYAFETICLKHSTEIKRALKIEGIASKNYTWSNPKAQVDLVIDRDDNWVNLCEMKFYNDEFVIDAGYLKRLETKKREFKVEKGGRKGVFLTMMTTHGVKSNKYSSAIVDHDLTMGCLFG
ncbi:MAG: AAA family ATPase [Crocinitomicaceae bacterium]|nr:ATP-binding protein [Flavobacteriales bacterium]NQZ36878.1 AAA family ATPase [Crocinitomicaceae bacterium]